MKELLFSVRKDDFRWDYFRCSGKGGQKVNKTSSGVRCTHEPSGASGKACDTRQQSKNKMLAWDRCVKSIEFRKWVDEKVVDITQKEAIEHKVNEEMRRVKVEFFNGTNWVSEESI